MVLDDPSLLKIFLDQVTMVGGSFVVVAAAIGIFWKWFMRDRWELAVKKAVGDPNKLSVIDHIDATTTELKTEINNAFTRIESIERKIDNGLTERIRRVEANSEELIKGVARIEGIIQVLVRTKE